MIFVTTGTEYFPFKRLVATVDKAKEEGILKSEVIVQTRDSSYKINNCRVYKMLPHHKVNELIQQCEIYICHAGVGSILAGLWENKNPLVIPRYRKYGEHIDDHQLDIAKEFERREVVSVCYEGDDLIQKIKKHKEYSKKLRKYEAGEEKKKMLNYIRAIIEE